MAELWSTLNSPELVFKVQSYFGVERDVEKKFRVRNKFFYYLFLLGTELGDEIFYGIFIPFMFFNVDAFIGRRFVFHWFLNMFIGQALKEVFKEERPKPPAIQMQSKWCKEFSLPSTHSMAALSISLSILYFSVNRYDFNLWLGIVFVILWVGVISLSRVYLGMHSVLDVAMGIFLSIILLALLLPYTNIIMNFFATTVASPFVFILLPIVLIIYFPTSKDWTPTRGDTCVIAAVFSGVELGVWFSHLLGMSQSKSPLDNFPLSFDFTDYTSLIARTVLGLAVAGATEFLGKYFSFSVLCFVLNEDKKLMKATENSVENSKKNLIDLTSKYFTYCLLGFNVVLVSVIFKFFNIQRDRFFNEL